MDIGLLDGVRSEDFMWKEFKCGLQRYIHYNAISAKLKTRTLLV
jgi:hypothetical protein